MQWQNADKAITQGKPATRSSGWRQQAVTASSHPILRLQRLIGNHAVGRLLDQASVGPALPWAPAGARLQRKVMVGAVGDPLEREADHVADTIMRMPETDIALSGRPQAVRKCAACEGEQARARRMPAAGAPGAGPAHGEKSCGCGGIARREALSASDGGVVADDAARALGPPGRPLPGQSRQFFEPRFGQDFSHVRVHTGADAARAAAAIDARAFTLGHDIAFAAGQYAPGTDAGDRLIAHELTHVVQQASPASSPPVIMRQVEISTFGGVPTVLDCELKEVTADPATSCCPDDVRKQVPALYVTAREYVDRVIARMVRGDNMDGAIASHFGADARWSRGRILANLRKIRAEVDRQNKHVLRCRADPAIAPADDLMDPKKRNLYCPFNALATGSHDPQFPWLTLCLGRDRVINGGWVTVLHELVHLSQIGDLPDVGNATVQQVARGEFETYAWQRQAGKYPNPNNYALRNADSYARFVEEVGKPSWSSESVPSWAPALSVGVALGLPQLRPGISGRATWIPIGSKHVQLLTSLQGFGLFDPLGNDPARAARPGDTRAHIGAEAGVRFLVGHGSVIGMFDIGLGGGVMFTEGEDRLGLAPGLTGRLGAGLRFGTPSLAFDVQAQVLRIVNFGRDQPWAPGQDWVPGLSIGGHWGGSSVNPR